MMEQGYKVYGIYGRVHERKIRSDRTTVTQQHMACPARGGTVAWQGRLMSYLHDHVKHRMKITDWICALRSDY